ncbi:25802_t:CDS:2, partial [Racocetra persica]
PHHAPQCSHNQNKPQQKPTLDPQQLAELSRLEKSLQSAVDLEALEVAYQNVKSNPLYQGESHRDNQGSLDTLYKMKKQLFQAQGQQQSLYDSNKRDGFCLLTTGGTPIETSELPTTYRSGGFSVPRQGYHLVSPKAQTEPFLPTSKCS